MAFVVGKWQAPHVLSRLPRTERVLGTRVQGVLGRQMKRNILELNKKKKRKDTSCLFVKYAGVPLHPDVLITRGHPYLHKTSTKRTNT